MKIFNITSDMTPEELKKLHDEAFMYQFIFGEVVYRVNYTYNEPNIQHIKNN